MKKTKVYIRFKDGSFYNYWVYAHDIIITHSAVIITVDNRTETLPLNKNIKQISFYTEDK